MYADRNEVADTAFQDRTYFENTTGSEQNGCIISSASKEGANNNDDYTEGNGKDRSK